MNDKKTIENHTSLQKTCKNCDYKKERDEFPLECHHKYCEKCLRKQWKSEVENSNCEILCLKAGCKVIPIREIIKLVLSEESYEIYRKLKKKKKQKKCDKCKGLQEIEILSCGHFLCFSCLRSKIRKKIKSEELTFKCEFDDELKMNRELLKKIDIDEKYYIIFKELKEKIKNQPLKLKEKTSKKSEVVDICSENKKKLKNEPNKDNKIKKDQNNIEEKKKIIDFDDKKRNDSYNGNSKYEEEKKNMVDKDLEKKNKTKKENELIKSNSISENSEFWENFPEDSEENSSKSRKSDKNEKRSPAIKQNNKISKDSPKNSKINEEYSKKEEEISSNLSEINLHKSNELYKLEKNCSSSLSDHQKMSKEVSRKEENEDKNAIINDKLRCPVCKENGQRKKGSNLIRCESNKCSKKTVFCGICNEKLVESDKLSHFIDKSEFKNCNNALKKNNSSKNEEEKIENFDDLIEYSDIKCHFCENRLKKSLKIMEVDPKLIQCNSEKCKGKIFCQLCAKEVLEKYIVDHIGKECFEEKKGFIYIDFLIIIAI